MEILVEARGAPEEARETLRMAQGTSSRRIARVGHTIAAGTCCQTRWPVLGPHVAREGSRRGPRVAREGFLAPAPVTGA